MTAATGNLREPEQMDWDNHNPQSRYTPPPPAQDPGGAWILYTAKLPKDLATKDKLGVNNEGFRSFEFGPLTLTLPQNKTCEVKFFTQSLKKYVNRKTGEEMNVSGVSKILRAAGFAGKPQTNAEYENAVRSVSGRTIQVTIDWRAKDKDTGEEVKGYELFPLDPERPGQRKPILKAGDVLTDGTVVKAPVLFANAQIRFVEGR